MWKGLKIVHGKPHHRQSQDSVERSNQDTKQLIGILLNKKSHLVLSFYYTRVLVTRKQL